jgi:hypothetical protein
MNCSLVSEVTDSSEVFLDGPEKEIRERIINFILSTQILENIKSSRIFSLFIEPMH